MQGRRTAPRLWRRWLLVIAIVVSSVLSQSSPAAGGAEPALASPFTFRFPDLEGHILDAADLRGKVVLVNIFATWCPPCLKEMPDLQVLSDTYKEQGLVVVGISLDRPGLMGLATSLRLREHLRRFAAKLHVSYPILLADQAITMMEDGQMVVRQLGGVYGIPMTYILDRDGQVVHTFIGYRKRAIFEQAVQRVLAR